MHDLFELVNGDWVREHEIPADRGIDGAFYALRDKSEEDVRALLRQGDSLGATLYASFMDTDTVNGAGVSPLDADLTKLSVKSVEDFARVLGELERVGIGAPLTYWVEKDSQSEDAVAYLVQSGLGLPDEAYYRAEEHAETLAAYKEHVARMLGFLPPMYLLGLDPKTAAERIVNLESSLASSHWDVVRSRDAMATYNPTTLDALPSNVQALLRASGLDDGKVIAMMPSYIEDLDAMLRPETLADWQLWAAWNILSARAGVLTEEIGQANFEFYGTKLSGATEQRDRWKRAVGLAESLVGEEIGQVYVEKHFPPSSKQHMLELVDYLLAAYRERISALDWMTEGTRERALEKLGQFQAKIGYPDRWRSFDGLDFDPEKLVDNVRRGSAFEHDYQLSKIGKPADRSEWVTTPQTVNAFYNPVVNDITFPAAILQPPFFDPKADAAENFGAIGAVIGHEIGHGFDDQGSRYDGAGNLNSWWTDEDRANFEALTKQLVDQFDGLVPCVLGEDSRGVNGEFTLGENIGDLGGLGIAVVAYERYLKERSLDDGPLNPFGDLDGEYTGFQRLFLAWARVWRSKTRPEMAAQLLAIDPHSPNEFRCNVIAANVAEFYEAFDVEPDSKMWIGPEKRVRIW